ncbi:hypothetical protein KSP39_PZI014528 [Platanthera zijinensis]|uniref:Uncharacterized protein n=1 Tax=Platanthera zijinensis TaxID=2320716 RepID=A0AAP0G2W6_9ASPA
MAVGAPACAGHMHRVMRMRRAARECTGRGCGLVLGSSVHTCTVPHEGCDDPWSSERVDLHSKGRCKRIKQNGVETDGGLSGDEGRKGGNAGWGSSRGPTNPPKASKQAGGGGSVDREIVAS